MTLNYWKIAIQRLLTMTWSSPRRSLFLHSLSFECTTKLCINLFNQFSVFLHLKSARQNLVIELCRGPKTILFFNGYLENLRIVLWLLNDWLFQKWKIPFYFSRQLSIFGLKKNAYINRIDFFAKRLYTKIKKINPVYVCIFFKPKYWELSWEIKWNFAFLKKPIIQ